MHEMVRPQFYLVLLWCSVRGVVAATGFRDAAVFLTAVGRGAAVFAAEDYYAVGGEAQRHGPDARDCRAYQRPAEKDLEGDQEVDYASAVLVAVNEGCIEVHCRS